MSSPSSRRLTFASALSVGLVAAIVIVPGSDPGREGSYRPAAETQVKKVLAADGHDHVHNDPKTKNAISRAVLSSETADPTTAAQARANAEYVESERWAEDPALTTAQLRGPRLAVPENRYAMAGGCYALAGQSVRFQATDLGRYLLYSTERKLLTAGILGHSVHWDVAPSPRGDWIVQKTLAGFTFRLDDGRRLTKSAGGFVTGPTGSAFALRTATGCPEYPEVDTNITGGAHAGVTPFQEVRGYVDPHVHGMALTMLVGDTGFEPVTSSVSGKRATDCANRPRWRRDLNPCTRICSPLPRLSATPPWKHCSPPGLGETRSERTTGFEPATLTLAR